MSQSDAKTNDRCQNCGERLEPVPSFSFGDTAVLHKCDGYHFTAKELEPDFQLFADQMKAKMFAGAGMAQSKSTTAEDEQTPTRSHQPRFEADVEPCPASNPATDRAVELYPTETYPSTCYIDDDIVDDKVKERSAFKAGWDARDEEVKRLDQRLAKDSIWIAELELINKRLTAEVRRLSVIAEQEFGRPDSLVEINKRLLRSLQQMIILHNGAVPGKTTQQVFDEAIETLDLSLKATDGR